MYRVAEWCREKGLLSDAKRLSWKVLEIDPSHKGARQDLGFRKLGAIWLTEEDYQRANGKVLYEKRWISKQEWQEKERKARSAAKLENAEQLLRTAAGKEPEEKRHLALQEFHELPNAYVQRGSLGIRRTQTPQRDSYREEGSREKDEFEDQHGTLLTRCRREAGSRRCAANRASRGPPEAPPPPTAPSAPAVREGRRTG